jgi:uroporphyrinogen decarboxylase
MGPASPFVRAARLEPVERTPVWFMRQAGRVLPEYRAVRERRSLVEITRQPELCAEVTLQPLRRFPLDAAVMFADIMTPLIAIGVEVEIVENVGPVIRHPIHDESGLAALRPIEPEADVPYVLETIRLLITELHPERALLGFAGAPFTLASYLVEGRPSRDFTRTKTLMYAHPALWHALMERLTTITSRYAQAQAMAGVDAIQLFDSWVGTLAPDDYAQFVQPYTRRVFAALESSGAARIHFGTNTAGLLHLMRNDGATVIGVDWRMPIDAAWKRVGHHLAIQGNLDPATLLAPVPVVHAKASDVLRRAGSRPGHIFNLGHGLMPDTPLDTIARLVDFVHERSTAIRADAA